MNIDRTDLIRRPDARTGERLQRAFQAAQETGRRARVSESAHIHPSALIEEGVVIGPRTSVWDNVHIRRDVVIGQECIVGEKSYIAYGVRVGDRVKINAFVYVCAGVTIEDGVMVSAGTIFTNDRLPRAATTDLARLRPSEPDEHTRRTVVRQGATIGAGCILGSGIEIGRFAMVGMGSLVTRSVPDFHLSLGHPAGSAGVVCRCGEVVLRFADAAVRTEAVCRACGLAYAVSGQEVAELSPPLPWRQPA